MNNAIEVKKLRKNYKDFLLNDISFSLPAGYIMGFVGQNGAGKTTTIRLMLNMAHREGGEIKLLGMDNLQDEQSIKQDVAVVLDEIYFVNNWTVREVEQVLKPFYVNWNSALFSQYAQQFRLPLDKKVQDLSLGMRLNLMLAVSMSHAAKLLILDGPTSGLDPVARDELLQMVFFTSACIFRSNCRSIFASLFQRFTYFRIYPFIWLLCFWCIYLRGPIFCIN